MPLYTYQCPCGLQFEGHASVKNRLAPKKCQCGGEAERIVPVDVTGNFHQEIDGPTPQNTGVSQIDLIADRAIGASAQKGWEVADRRLQTKRTILDHHPEASGHDLSRNPDGTYRVMTPQERGVHERAQAINSKAMSTLSGKSSKEKPSE